MPDMVASVCLPLRIQGNIKINPTHLLYVGSDMPVLVCRFRYVGFVMSVYAIMAISTMPVHVNRVNLDPVNSGI